MILLAVSLADLAVIYVVKKRLLKGTFSSVKATESPSQFLPARTTIHVTGMSFAVVTYALALAPSIYGLVYFLLGGSLNWFILFVAVTMLGFLLFKPKEEELKKFFWTETSN